MKPTIGRIVIFKHCLSDEESPAIVVNVRENGNVDLNIFNNGTVAVPGVGVVAHVTYDSNVKEGSERGTWHWPPRV
jgi:hypothetical protein